LKEKERLFDEKEFCDKVFPEVSLQNGIELGTKSQNVQESNKIHEYVLSM
jgi:hypothetical protein